VAEVEGEREREKWENEKRWDMWDAGWVGGGTIDGKFTYLE
jgi:hypothetical protein